MAKFQNKYGYFTDDGGEYVITNCKTPKPWVNVISNGTYGMVISQLGGGFSWDTHSEFNRLNRWHQDLVQDNWGKYFYFRDNLTGEFWSPTWLPVKCDLESLECRHGLGYTGFTSVYKNIKVTLTVFIPFDDNVEIWDFRIENKTGKTADLSVFTYFEWCMGSSSDFHREFHKSFIETHFHEDFNMMTATKRLWEIPLGDRGHWNIEYPYFGFISASKKISSYEGDKEKFLGNYGSLDKPLGVVSGVLSNSKGKWSDSVAVVKTDIKIAASGSDYLTFYMGIKPALEEIEHSLKKYQTREQINNELITAKARWSKLLGPLHIETPDEAMNIMVNKWLRYQAISGRLWGRTAYYQQSGAFGFRDQLQDSLVYLPIKPELTAHQLKLHARHQFTDGTVLHWWHPISETGLPTNMVDDLLWLPYILTHYIDETHDYTILDHKEPYYDDKEKLDSMFDHSVAAIERVLMRFSERGLPLIGAGDWNDGLSAAGLDMKGESVWMAEFFYLILNRFGELCAETGRHELETRYREKAAELKAAFDRHAWDGEWYYRGTKDNGEKFGSHVNNEGKIFLNPQTWSVISGIGEPEKVQRAMDSVTKHLLKNNGTLLLSPAYSEPDKMIGYLSRYAPGRRENGGVYTHAATWSIWAYSLLLDSFHAFESFRRLCPVYSGMDPDKYVAEPYVTPGNIDGPESPNYGMGGWTWYTGSAAWFQKVIVDWILGIRASKKGLVISPNIPAEWKHYTVKRRFRMRDYHIEVINEDGGTSRIREITVNGVKIEGNVIPVVEDGPKANVKVYLIK